MSPTSFAEWKVLKPAAIQLAMQPLSKLPVEGVRALLFDLDGTLVDEQLGASAYTSLHAARDAGLRTIAVTGRSAGWCDLMARWWPLDGVVGENGAVVMRLVDGRLQRSDWQTAEESVDRLEELWDTVYTAFPDAQQAADQPWRVHDLAIDFAEEANLGLEWASSVAEFVRAQGARAAISNIHVNCWFGDWDKLAMSERLLAELEMLPEACVYVGDSPNDAPMFHAFDLSVGVASVTSYGDLLEHPPHYVTKSDGGAGFAEVVAHITR
ncbi:MAG: HAD-IIB family hydrolase [Candidatus Poseidoniia archaeon]|nr:HAD-IIB family hydrolase [Candidatus Poseidoniia archaeon]